MRREAFDKLRAEDPDARSALVQRLLGQVAALSAQVQELEARVGQHSQHSHRPPSSEARPVPTRSQRRAQGKRPGGQPGQRGQTLAMRAAPDAVVAHQPRACGHCGADLTAVSPRAAERRQVVDLPPLAVVVTEQRAAMVCCPHCQQATTAPFPAGVQPGVQYGPRVLGLGLYLRHYHLLPYLRIQETLTDLFGASPGVGTLHTAGQRAAGALLPVETALKAALAAAGLLHADETGIRVQGRGVWVHVAAPRGSPTTPGTPSAGRPRPPPSPSCPTFGAGSSTTPGPPTGTCPVSTAAAMPTCCATSPPWPNSRANAGPPRCGHCCARCIGP